MVTGNHLDRREVLIRQKKKVVIIFFGFFPTRSFSKDPWAPSSILKEQIRWGQTANVDRRGPRQAAGPAGGGCERFGTGCAWSSETQTEPVPRRVGVDRGEPAPWGARGAASVSRPTFARTRHPDPCVGLTVARGGRARTLVTLRLSKTRRSSPTHVPTKADVFTDSDGLGASDLPVRIDRCSWPRSLFIVTKNERHTASARVVIYRSRLWCGLLTTV